MDFYDYVLSRVKNMQERQVELLEKIKYCHLGLEAVNLNIEYEKLQYATTMIWFMLEHKDYIKNRENIISVHENKEVKLPKIKKGDLVKIQFTLTDIRVAEIQERYDRHNNKELIAKFGTQYIYYVVDNSLYHITNKREFVMAALSTWQLLGIYRYNTDIEDEGYTNIYYINKR